jgi:hypothetical protein
MTVDAVYLDFTRVCFEPPSETVSTSNRPHNHIEQPSAQHTHPHTA